MSEKLIDASRSAVRNIEDVPDNGLALFAGAFREITLICTWRGMALCALGAHLLLSACAGGGGGSSHSGTPSSPPDSPSSEPDSPDEPPPPPPPGALSIPLGSSVESNLAPIEETNLRFGRAFGAGPDLGRVVAVDSFGQLYWIDLSDRTKVARRSFGLLDWLSQSTRRFGLAGQTTTRLGLSLDFFARARLALLENGQYEDKDIVDSFTLTADFNGSRLSFLRDWGLGRHFGFNAEVRAEDHNLMGISVFDSPYLSLMGTGDGMVFAREIGEDAFLLRLGFATERSSGSANSGGDAEVLVGEVIGRLSNGSWIGLQLGRTLEGNRLLGSEGNGAFELPPTSTTLFTGLAGSLYVNDRLELFGQASLGFTEPAGSAQGLLKEVSALRSSSFGFGITHREVLAANDRLTMALSQPLRVDAGTAIFDRAVGWTSDGHIVRQRERISLEPEGREIDIEVGYLFPLGSNVNMSLNWLGQLEPGHDRDASPAHTLALKLRAEF